MGWRDSSISESKSIGIVIDNLTPPISTWHPPPPSGTLPVDKPNKVESGTGLFKESGTATGSLKDSVFKDSVQK